MSTKLERDYPTVHELGGTIYNVRRLADPDIKEWSATNLSIGYHKSTGYIAMFRSGNYVITEQGEYKVVVEGLIRSKIYISELDPKTYKLTNVRLLDVKNISDEGELRRGLEDPKLFYRDNAWHFSAVTMEKGHTEVARMSICRLNKDLTAIESFEKLSGIDGVRPEKNWMTPYDKSPYFDWIYGTNALLKENILTTYLDDNEQIAGLRGSSNLHLLKDGTYLSVVHRMWTRVIMNHNLRFYVHYFANYDERGKIIGISKGFIFENMGVEFAAGLCEQGDNFLISYGSKDVSSHIASMQKETVMKSLQPIRTKI
jgi:hypothetical protein